MGSVAPGGRQQFFPSVLSHSTVHASFLDGQRGAKGKERGKLEPRCHPARFLARWLVKNVTVRIRSTDNHIRTAWLSVLGRRCGVGDAAVWRDRISLFCQILDASYCRVGIPILRRLCFPGFLFGCNLFRNAWSIVCLPRRGPRCFKQPHSSFSTSALEPTSLVDSIAQR